MKNMKDTPGMSLIFDVKKFEPGKSKFEDYGYSIFPLFDKLETDEDYSAPELYVNSGIYSVSRIIIYDLLASSLYGCTVPRPD